MVITSTNDVNTTNNYKKLKNNELDLVKRSDIIKDVVNQVVVELRIDVRLII